MPQQGTGKMDLRSKRYSVAQILEMAGWIAIASYSLLVLLYVIPFYNRWYRVTVNLLGTIMLFVSIVVVPFVLVPLCLFKRQYSRAVIIVALELILIFATHNAYNWRVRLTERLVQAYYCRENRPVEAKLVLGGIINTGQMFINDSHCLIVVCDEEFYYCDRPAERQSERHR